MLTTNQVNKNVYSEIRMDNSLASSLYRDVLGTMSTLKSALKRLDDRRYVTSIHESVMKDYNELMNTLDAAIRSLEIPQVKYLDKNKEKVFFVDRDIFLTESKGHLNIRDLRERDLLSEIDDDIFRTFIFKPTIDLRCESLMAKTTFELACVFDEIITSVNKELSKRSLNFRLCFEQINDNSFMIKILGDKGRKPKSHHVDVINIVYEEIKNKVYFNAFRQV